MKNCPLMGVSRREIIVIQGLDLIGYRNDDEGKKLYKIRTVLLS